MSCSFGWPSSMTGASLQYIFVFYYTSPWNPALTEEESYFIAIRNCSEPSRFSCKSVNHACMNEHFFMEIYLADTPHRRNAQHFGGGSEQLQNFYEIRKFEVRKMNQNEVLDIADNWEYKGESAFHDIAEDLGDYGIISELKRGNQYFSIFHDHLLYGFF